MSMLRRLFIIQRDLEPSSSLFPHENKPLSSSSAFSKWQTFLTKHSFINNCLQFFNESKRGFQYYCLCGFRAVRH